VPIMSSFSSCIPCRFLVGELGKVNPAHMSNDEKLAFWINLYNALLMHVSITLILYFCLSLSYTVFVKHFILIIMIKKRIEWVDD